MINFMIKYTTFMIKYIITLPASISWCEENYKINSIFSITCLVAYSYKHWYVLFKQYY